MLNSVSSTKLQRLAKTQGSGRTKTDSAAADTADISNVAVEFHLNASVPRNMSQGRENK